MIMYPQTVYDIYEQMFRPDPTPCLDFLKELVKQKGFQVNIYNAKQRAHVSLEDVHRWVACLIRLGLLMKSRSICIDKIGMGRFENQSRAQRRVNTNIHDRALYLINQQLYAPPLDRIYFNSSKEFQRRTDQVVNVIGRISVSQSYITGLLLFAEQEERTRDNLVKEFGNMAEDLWRVVDAMLVQGLLKKTENDVFVANHNNLHKEIKLITSVSEKNHRRLLPCDMREIVAQQVFRGNTDVQRMTESSKKYKNVVDI